jgi:cytochrome P450
MLNEAPGPRGWPLVGVAPRFRRDPLSLLMNAAAEYGDVVQLPLFRLPMTPLEPKQRVYVVSDPALVRQICLVDRHKCRTHAQLVDKLKLVLELGDGELLTSTHDDWVKRKLTLQPPFSASESWAPAVVRLVEAMAERWLQCADGITMDLDREMTALVTNMFARLFAGIDLDGADADVAQDWNTVLNGFSRRMAMPFRFLLGIPTRANRRFRTSLEAVEQRLAAVVREHRQCPHRSSDVLSAWLRSSHTRGEELSEKTIRDQVILLLVAGRKNVSNALTWACHLLGQHPDVAAAVAGEVEACDDWKRRTYTAAVQKEVLRLYPTAWLIARCCLEDYVVGGYRIPAGSTVFMSPYVIHRRPRLWPQAEHFDPRRFLGESGRRIPPDAYLPFGIGPRTCIGSAMTEVIMRVTIATLASRFEFRPVPGHEVAIRATSSLYPRCGMPMVVSRRRVKALCSGAVTHSGAGAIV